MLVLAAESKCAIAAQFATWVQIRGAYIVPDERHGLGELDGVIGIRGWDMGGIKAACILMAWKTALR